jgi:predicted ATPase
MFNGQSATLSLNTGLCVFVGPNGSGKSETLRTLRDHLRRDGAALRNKQVVYLAAGRNSIFESYRSTGTSGPQYINVAPAAVGNQSWQKDWWQFEGNAGMLLRLKERPDLLLKIEARLQALYQRQLQLDWSQSGLQLVFRSTRGGASYYANVEASGVLELVPLLTARYLVTPQSPPPQTPSDHRKTPA